MRLPAVVLIVLVVLSVLVASCGLGCVGLVVSWSEVVTVVVVLIATLVVALE